MEHADCPHPYRFHKYNLIPKRPRNNDQLFRLENIFQVQNANHLIWNGSWILHSVAGRKTICLFCCLHLLKYDDIWWWPISQFVLNFCQSCGEKTFPWVSDKQFPTQTDHVLSKSWTTQKSFEGIFYTLFYANYIFLTEINWESVFIRPNGFSLYIVGSSLVELRAVDGYKVRCDCEVS